jgi:hypothetical protein
MTAPAITLAPDVEWSDVRRLMIELALIVGRTHRDAGKSSADIYGYAARLRALPLVESAYWHGFTGQARGMVPTGRPVTPNPWGTRENQGGCTCGYPHPWRDHQALIAVFA